MKGDQISRYHHLPYFLFAFYIVRKWWPTHGRHQAPSYWAVAVVLSYGHVLVCVHIFRSGFSFPIVNRHAPTSPSIIRYIAHTKPPTFKPHQNQASTLFLFEDMCSASSIMHHPTHHPSHHFYLKSIKIPSLQTEIRLYDFLFFIFVNQNC